VWLIACVCLQISFFVLLIPSYIYLVFTEKDLQVQSSDIDARSGVTNIDDVTKTFLSVNSELSALSVNSGSNKLDFFISHISSIIPSGVRIQEINYALNTASTSTIILRGTADTRDTLLSFSKKIQADQLFSNVDLPVSNFAKDTNIDFSMTITAQN
jgi:hypothetical protein